MSATRIWLDEVDVTAYVPAREAAGHTGLPADFPEWLETSMKGPGFFDWEVKKFDFRLHESAPVTPAIGQYCRIEINGVQRLTGLVQALKDETSKVPMVTVYPPATTLKDVQAGTPGTDPRTGAGRYLFELDDVTVQEAVEAVLERYEFNRNPLFTLPGDWVVDVQGDGADPVPIYSAHDLTGPEEGERFFRPELEPYPVVGVDEATVMETIPTARWLEVRIDPSTGEMLIGVLRPQWAVDAATEQYYAYPYYHYARCPLEGFPDTSTLPFEGYWTDFDPQDPLRPPEDDWWRMLDLAGNQSTRIDPAQALYYVKTELGLPPDQYLPFMAVIASIDHPTGTWTIIQQPADLDAGIHGRLFAVWWGNPLVQRITGKWENTSMIDLVKLFAMVSGRWLRIEGTTVSLVPRDGDTGHVILPQARQAIEYSRERQFSTPGEISIALRDASDPDSRGLVYPSGKVAALQYHYIDRYSGEEVRTKATYPITLLPAGLELLSGGIEPGELSDVRQVVNLDFATSGRLFRTKTLEEAV